jgi:hypothetical protein
MLRPSSTFELLMGYVLVADAEGVSLEQPGLDVEEEDARLVVLGIVQSSSPRMFQGAFGSTASCFSTQF